MTIPHIKILVDRDNGNAVPDGKILETIDAYVEEINNGATSVGPIGQHELLLGLRLAKKQGRLISTDELRVVDVESGNYEVVDARGRLGDWPDWVPGTVGDKLLVQIL